MINSRIISLLPLGKRLLCFESKLMKTPANNNILLSSEQRRGYKNFGHKRVRESTLSNIFYVFLTLGINATVIDWRW